MNNVFNCSDLTDHIVRHGVRFAYNPEYGSSKNADLFVPYTRRGEIKDLSESWPKKLLRNGVYVMFEKGETFNGKDRIVRIGINREGDRLLDRLENHYLGTGKSIFRKHLASCFLNPNSPYYNADFLSDTKKLKDAVTKYVQDNITFSIINVPNKEKRELLEKMLIATIAKCNDCKASDKWLGKYSESPAISNGKLWNVQGLNSTPLNEEMTELIKDWLVMEPDLSSFILDD